MHEGVDLELGLVERVLGGRDHVAVDDLADAGVQAHLMKKSSLGSVQIEKADKERDERRPGRKKNYLPLKSVFQLFSFDVFGKQTDFL